MVLPKFLRETGYKSPLNHSHCAFQQAHHTDQTTFDWMASHPIVTKNFLRWLETLREGLPIQLDVFPFRELLSQDLLPETPVFVDIGGGSGEQCMILTQRFPQLQGHVIHQDLPHFIKTAIPVQVVKLMTYDFWTPQPIRSIFLAHAVPNDQS